VVQWFDGHLGTAGREIEYAGIVQNGISCDFPAALHVGLACQQKNLHAQFLIESESTFRVAILPR